MGPEVHSMLWSNAHVIALSPEAGVDVFLEKFAVDLAQLLYHARRYNRAGLSGGDRAMSGLHEKEPRLEGGNQ